MRDNKYLKSQQIVESVKVREAGQPTPCFFLSKLQKIVWQASKVKSNGSHISRLIHVNEVVNYWKDLSFKINFKIEKNKAKNVLCGATAEQIGVTFSSEEEHYP